MIAVSYLMKRKIKKVFYEIISNTKNFLYKIFFFNEVANDQEFAKLIGGQDKGGIGQRRIR